jgi:hypothetical protein
MSGFLQFFTSKQITICWLKRVTHESSLDPAKPSHHKSISKRCRQKGLNVGDYIFILPPSKTRIGVLHCQVEYPSLWIHPFSQFNPATHAIETQHFDGTEHLHNCLKAITISAKTEICVTEFCSRLYAPPVPATKSLQNVFSWSFSHLNNVRLQLQCQIHQTKPETNSPLHVI